ncbi:MAG: hypothetical protein M3018_06780 [Actinomycetota bacterium]|nr:hypothetical protein [Actinomycetota bacterium]
MSQAEHPERLQPDHEVTVEDMRQLMGASTPHFALQLRERIRALIRGLPSEHPARIEGKREIVRLDRIAFAGEIRGHPPEDGLEPLPSVAEGHLEPRPRLADVHPEPGPGAGDGRPHRSVPAGEARESR